MIALLIGYESITRLYDPVPIAFAQAIPLAAIGLGVNLASAWLLRDGHEHAHEHANDHDHDHHHSSDNNLRAAYIHVVADAAVSLLALIGLTAALQFGWPWLDPLMGVIGAAVIANWSISLMRRAGAVLLDMRSDESLARRLAERIEQDGDRITDLHLWRVGPGHNAAVVSIVSDRPEPPEFYKARLSGLHGLSHVTIEIQPCPGEHA
jgi:cation diffusion facilitator family transporter